MPLGLESMNVAYGITQVANSAMTRVLRAVSTERGRDPREYTVVAFGGAGPIHAAALAENMDITRIVVPLYPGLFSALGLLLADYRHDYIASVAAQLTAINPDAVLARYDELMNAARAEMASEGVAGAGIRFEQYVDLKYGYQMYEMTLPFPTASRSDLRAALGRVFTEAHQRAYGYHRDDPIELVNLRLRALASAGGIRFADLAPKLSAGDGAPEGTREAYFGPRQGTVMTPIRHRLAITGPQAGPVIIEEPDTTVVVPPGWTVERDATANLILSRG
jgi:N-methylhydantoinase A